MTAENKDYQARLQELYGSGLTTRQANAQIPIKILNELSENGEEQIVIPFETGQGKKAIKLASALRRRATKNYSVKVGVRLGGENPQVILKRLS